MIIRSEKVKGGKNKRRHYGWLHYLNDGRKIYLAKRTNEEIFKCGREDVSTAVREGVAEWAIDYETLIEMRMKGVRFVGVRMEDTQDVYLASMDDWYDPAKAKFRNYEARGGALQKYMNFTHFTMMPGATTLKAKRKPKRKS